MSEILAEEQGMFEQMTPFLLSSVAYQASLVEPWYFGEMHQKCKMQKALLPKCTSKTIILFPEKDLFWLSQSCLFWDPSACINSYTVIVGGMVKYYILWKLMIVDYKGTFIKNKKRMFFSKFGTLFPQKRDVD